MTATPLSDCHQPNAVPERPARLGSRGTLIAAIGYPLAWIAGLSVFSSNTQVRADGAEVLRGLAGHEFAASLQYALTEGVTALCLIVVVWGVTSAGGPGRARRTACLATLAATVISLAECGLGLWLSAGIAHTGDASAAGAVGEAITRLDGAKMLLLALVALTIRAHSRLLPRWLSPLAVALAIAITVSGVGYLTLDDAAATAAWVSLPLLIIFITAAGLATAGFPKRRAQLAEQRTLTPRHGKSNLLLRISLASKPCAVPDSGFTTPRSSPCRCVFLCRFMAPVTCYRSPLPTARIRRDAWLR